MKDNYLIRTSIFKKLNLFKSIENALSRPDGVNVEQFYFDIPDEIRYERNRKRNIGNDSHSFKIEEKDIAFFDDFFETPNVSENDKVFTQ